MTRSGYFWCFKVSVCGGGAKGRDEGVDGGCAWIVLWWVHVGVGIRWTVPEADACMPLRAAKMEKGGRGRIDCHGVLRVIWKVGDLVRPRYEDTACFRYPSLLKLTLRWYGVLYCCRFSYTLLIARFRRQS